MQTSAAKLTPKRDTSAVLTEAVRNRVSAAAKNQAKVAEPDAKFNDIAANPFHKIMFSEALKPEEKRAEYVKLLTKENIKAFEIFKEYLASVREEMAADIIRLTDTDTFSELQKSYNEFGEDLIRFNETMQPLTDILDAVYTLRTNGVTFDAFNEIAQDRKREAEALKIRGAKERELDVVEQAIENLSKDAARLSEQRAWFGFGPVKQDAREAIATKNVTIEQQRLRLDGLKTEIEKLGESIKPGDDGKYAAEKQKLRELIDISSEEHSERQRALVDAALKFVKTSKERVGNVREHLGKMDNQMANLFEANNSMTMIYAIMDGAVHDAAEENQKIRATLAKGPDNEEMLARAQREQQKMNVESFIGVLDDTAKDTRLTYADLTSQSIRIKTMKDATAAQAGKARALATQGIGGVADRLSVVLQAVSSAALGESSAMAKDTLVRMADNTNLIAQKEVIRVATGVDEANRDVAKALDDLGAYGDVMKAATDITRTGLTEMRGKLEELKQLAADTVDIVHESVAVAAEVGGAKKEPPAPKAADAPSDPFKLGRVA